jgi:SPP1 family phage portal protein
MQELPIFELNNNFDSMGDFVNVIDLVNAYSSIQSTTLNDFEFFQNAILILKGYGRIDPEEMAELFKDRVWQMDEGSDAKYLNKEIPFQPQEAFKKRLLEDISLTSQTPLLKDEYFGGNASGVAFDYKLWAIEQKALLKENFTKTFLNKKFEYLKSIFRIFYSDVDSPIKITFYRNAPKSKIEELNYLKGLVGITSNRTILENLSIIEDVEQELERIEEESNVEDSYLNEPIETPQMNLEDNES